MEENPLSSEDCLPSPVIRALQPEPPRALAHSPVREGSGREEEGVLCDLQSEAVSGPDASPHPLHVAEEHDDAEEGEVAGNTYEGAGHWEVVQQVPEAERRDRRQQSPESTSLLIKQQFSALAAHQNSLGRLQKV